MKKDLKQATTQELNEMINILKTLKKGIKSYKGKESNEINFITDEIDKKYYDLKDLENRLSFFIKG